MGYFSWECKGCNQELISGELVRLNGCNGEYDGYGNAGGFEYANSGSGDPSAWHQKCYGEASDSQKLDETPSRHARNQGCGFPRRDCIPSIVEYVEPPRVTYAAIPIDHIMIYLKGLWEEDQKRENGFTWFRDMTLADMVYDDLKAARENYGERFSQDYVEETDWGTTDPGQHWRNMEERFQGLHLMVSEIAHAAIVITRRRLGGLGPIGSL
jgi:hypothetical protein